MSNKRNKQRADRFGTPFNKVKGTIVFDGKTYEGYYASAILKFPFMNKNDPKYRNMVIENIFFSNDLLKTLVPEPPLTGNDGFDFGADE